MKRVRTSLIHIFLSLLILYLCFGAMTACAKDSSVEVLKQEKIAEYTVAACKFPDKTIRLALKKKEGYEPFFTMYEADVRDVPIEDIQIQTGYRALEHDCIRVKFRMEPFALIDPDKEVYRATALVYDWQDGKVMVSNVNKCARQIYNLPDATVYSAYVNLPEGVMAAYPDANIYPEYGKYMTFKFDYMIPPDKCCIADFWI